jgi:hypothetical protein
MKKLKFIQVVTMNKYNFSVVSILLFLQPEIFAQEEVRSLIYNPAYSVKDKHHSEHTLKTGRLKSAGTTLFFDDFAYNFADSVIYPDRNHWVDSDAFVNTSYSDDPISIGVATLDALDKNGKLYNEAGTGKSFTADHLTSVPVSLKSYTSDSGVCLSFFYQPGGLGEPPDIGDSLLLLFREPLTKKWDTVWKVPGDSVKPFKRVIIPITSTDYLQDSFQFRFINYASINVDYNTKGKNGNSDIWNLDYIKLFVNRTGDTDIIKDLAIIKPLHSALSQFESMPWKHFTLPDVYTKEMTGVYYLYVRNNYASARNTERSYYCTDMKSGLPPYELIPASATYADSGQVIIFKDSIQQVIYNDRNENSAIFKITASLQNNTNDDPKQNDTVNYFQIFDNYYGYDDGTAEFGYGLKGEGSAHSMVAYKFPGHMSDTLWAVNMYFNRSINDDNAVNFYLTVWSSKNGFPDKILYQKDKNFSKYYKTDTLNSDLNRFQRFDLDTPVVVPDTFFVGWTQKQVTFLNIGLDINRNAGYNAKDNLKWNRIYYNLSGNSDDWSTSTVTGALMIRPILGTYLISRVSVRQTSSESPELYPNPVSDRLNIRLPGNMSNSKIKVLIFDLTGKMVLNEVYAGQQIQTGKLNSGIYLLRLQNNSGWIYNSKIVISRR